MTVLTIDWSALVLLAMGSVMIGISTLPGDTKSPPYKLWLAKAVCVLAGIAFVFISASIWGRP